MSTQSPDPLLKTAKALVADRRDLVTGVRIGIAESRHVARLMLKSIAESRELLRRADDQASRATDLLSQNSPST